MADRETCSSRICLNCIIAQERTTCLNYEQSANQATSSRRELSHRILLMTSHNAHVTFNFSAHDAQLLNTLQLIAQ